jgi:phosphoglycerol transferase MdoB-like AlkP superfamily enzyme
MKKRLRILGLLGLFWVAFFVACRALFLFYHFGQTATLSAKEIATIFLLGLRMDLAMTGYWLVLPGLVLSIPYLHRGQGEAIHSVTLFFLLISSIIVVVDLELYTHWGFRINETPLFYIGSGALGSVQPYRLILQTGLLGLLVLLFVFLYWKVMVVRFGDLRPLPLAFAPVMLLITASLIIPIRSSLTVAPLNSGVVYFHKTRAFPNHAGINATWNFFNAVLAQEHMKYSSDFYKGNDSRQILAQLVESTNPSRPLLRLKRPNIILIALESFTSNIIAPLGGKAGVTPNLNRLIPAGVLFDNLFASGDRTDKALVSILSGFPAQPNSSIIKYPEKTEHLPFLPRVLSGLGYHTSFVYGGDIGFANMESYLNTAGFSHITTDDDFDEGFLGSKWGIADQYLFERLLQECDTARGPFFKVALTLSSHEPFDVPMKTVFPGSDENSMFLNASHYTDKCLGELFRQASQRSWWKETLIILIADHGHQYPDPYEFQAKGRFKIPMLWLGGALAVRDSVIHTFADQPDMVNTLLAQVDKVHPEFQFSKDILDRKARPFAVYMFQNGFGYVDPTGEMVYDFDYKVYVLKTAGAEGIKSGSAYIQALFDAYNSL